MSASASFQLLISYDAKGQRITEKAFMKASNTLKHDKNTFHVTICLASMKVVSFFGG